MTSLLLLFSAGIIAVGYLPTLPPLLSGIIFLPLIFFVMRFPLLKLPVAFAVGASYAIAVGHHYLANQLAHNLSETKLVVEGRVVDLPSEDPRRQVFTFAVSKAFSNINQAAVDSRFPRRITLSSYGSLRVKSGEQWRFLVKIKRPRGLVNPAGYDYQVAMMRRGIGATGYIIANSKNKLLSAQPNYSVDVLRYQLQQWLLQQSDSAEKGVLLALLVGDTSLVHRDTWDQMLKTGTNHLIAISGLHLGFFSIVGFFLGSFLGRFVQLFWRSCPAMYLGYLFAIALTLFYSLIAGLNIPTLRTLIMLAVVQGVLLWRRSFRGRDTLLIALVLVLLLDPLAAFDIGFWLSFSAVALLMFCFAGRITRPEKTLPLRLWGHLRTFIKSQWVMFIGLLIPLALLVHSITFLAPLANFVAIPLVTFFVVPSLILAAVMHCLGGGFLDAMLLQFAEFGLRCLSQWLGFLVKLDDGTLTPLITINTWALGLGIISIFLILLPKELGQRWIGVGGMFLALIIPPQKLPDLQMLVFDVGQGTAVLIRTPRHQLLYDTGPQFTEKFDAGRAIILPYLRSQGLRRLNTVVVSHNDKDHSGGLPGIVSSTKIDRLLLGEPDKYSLRIQQQDWLTASAAMPSSTSCHQIQPWRWEAVNFTFIAWPLNISAKANNRSCVLLIEYGDYKILLPGDIEKEVEQILLAQNSVPPVNILLAPHHGSRTSSTPAFIAQTSPDWVIYSAGYHNQHGHPHKNTTAGYTEIGTVALNTALHGAIEFTWDKGVLSARREYRQYSRRYWFDEEK